MVGTGVNFCVSWVHVIEETPVSKLGSHGSHVLSQVPVNLLRAGRIFVFEPPPGVKANMLRTFSSIPVSRICKV
jgi:hypothetical protein